LGRTLEPDSTGGLNMSIIKSKLLSNYTEIAHFCTTQYGGVSMGNYASFNLSPFSGDDKDCFISNQKSLSNSLGIETNRLILPYQIHGTEIREIGEQFLQLPMVEKDNYLYGVDALFTRLPRLCIGITTADCVPLLFFDPNTHVIAAAHAGWRGTCDGIAQKTIQAMTERYNCLAKDICVTIGPSISAEVYEVGKEVVERFEAAGFDLKEIVTVRKNKFHLDLWKANQLLLEKSGILKEHIEISGICTYSEHERFFSARRLGIHSGRILSGIMLK